MKQSIIFLAITALGLSAGAENLKRDDWTWSSSSICAAGTDSDILGLDGIHDGDANTCWHSNYRADDSSPERRNPHWVQIDRGSDRAEFNGLSYLPRQLSPKTACTSYYIYLSDTDMSSTPASSAQDIIAALGEPDFSGTLTGDITEKHIDFKEKFTSRYILFVNVESNGSSSAACAEMNLFYGEPSGGGATGPGNYNAICITPSAADATPHRIAIQGDKLTASVNHGYVRLGNEDITVEYAMADVARFTFEYYDFGDADSYTGDKKDIYTSRFTPTVKPAAGEISALNEVSIEFDPASGSHRINPEATLPVTITRGGDAVMSVDAASLPDFASDKGYTFTGINATSAGTYTLNIPEELFILADGSRSNSVAHAWTITGLDGISSVAADCQTLTFNRSGSTLTVGGISGASSAELFNAAGRSVATAPVNSRGEARFNVGALTKGVYFLHVNDITLKIIL